MHLMRAALARERQAHGSQAGLCRWPVLAAKRTICWVGKARSAGRLPSWEASRPGSRAQHGAPCRRAWRGSCEEVLAAALLKLHHHFITTFWRRRPRFGRAAR